MAKKEIEVVLKTNDNIIKNNILGIVNNTTIKYNDGGVIVVITTQEDRISMSRTTDEYQLILNFIKDKEELGSYLLKETNAKFDILVKTKILEINDNNIKIVYELNDEKKEFSLLIKE